MLSYDEEKVVPLCPQCSKELKEIRAITKSTNYYDYDYKTRRYNLANRISVEDDNLFHCPECGAGISSKEIFETLVFLNKMEKSPLTHIR